ncbi:outer membrane protein [Hydrogenimonas sp.]|nr:outer membrane protein [Hydrogenimonas sp.]
MVKRAATLWLLTLCLALAEPLPVEFSGNRSFDERSLYEAMGIEKPYFFEFWKKRPKVDPKKLDVLIPLLENFYKSHGFYHANITYRVGNGKIEIDIKENRPVTVEDISYISPLDIEELLPFKKGDRFDAEKFVESKEKIKEFYAYHRYCNVNLDSKAYIDIENDKAYIVYDIEPNEPCLFGEITIKTPPKLDEKIVRSLLYFKEDDPYSAELIKKSYKEIYANEGVERVIIDDAKHEGNRVPVKVTVSLYPKPVHFSAGAGYSSDEGLNLQMGIKHRNFPKNLKTVGLQTRYSQIRRYVKATYEMPLPNHNRFAGEIGFSNEIFDGYKESSLRAKLLLKQLRWPQLLQESVSIDKTTTSESLDTVNFPNGRLLIVSVNGGWEIDRRDSVLNPTKGYKIGIEASGSVKSAISDATYYKLLLTGVHHTPLTKATLSLRLRQGVIKAKQGHIPPSYRFYAGGMNSNRAFGYRQLGPKNSLGDPVGAFSLTEATAEYRFDIGKNFRGVLFSDVTYLGQNSLPDYKRGYISVGPGIRYMTPIGPIAFDLGFNAQNFGSYTLHFHIGELF